MSDNVVGAYSGSDPYEVFNTALKWITETQRKLPTISQAVREEACHADPMLNGVIVPFLRNYLLSSGHIETSDNKLYENEIRDIETKLNDLKLLDAFREDFVPYYVTKGHSYRRLDRDMGILDYLAPLNSTLITTYTDPWDSRILAYHQHINVMDAWSESSTETEHNCWWIPGVEPGKQYVELGSVKDPGVKETFETYATKYGISAKLNLRIGSNKDILAMHKVGLDDPAPIDNVVLAIWLKRLLLVNSPNMVFRVLSPILQLKKGVMLKHKDDQGNETLITSVPQEPPADMADTNPEEYNRAMAELSNYNKALKTGMDNVIKCLKDGGVYGCTPDEELNVVESGRNLTYLYVGETIKELNEEIGQAFGFPVALITASGSELATSRTIESTLSKTLVGIKGDYERKADWIISEVFGDQYNLDEMQLHYVLDTPDLKDLLQDAQTKLALSDTLLKLKQLGASKADMQALCDEMLDVDILELDGYDKPDPVQPTQFQQTPQPTQSSAVDDLNPSDSDEADMKEAIWKIYKQSQKNLIAGIEEVDIGN